MKKLLIILSVLLATTLSAKTITKNGKTINDYSDIIKYYEYMEFPYDSITLLKYMNIEEDTMGEEEMVDLEDFFSSSYSVISDVTNIIEENRFDTYTISYIEGNKIITDTIIDRWAFDAIINTNDGKSLTGLNKFVLNNETKLYKSITADYSSDKELMVSVMLNLTDNSLIDGYMIALIEAQNFKKIKIYEFSNGIKLNGLFITISNDEIVKTQTIDYTTYSIENFKGYPSNIEKIVKKAYEMNDREYSKMFVKNAFYRENLVKINNEYVTVELTNYYNKALLKDCIVTGGCLMKKGAYIPNISYDMNALRYIDTEEVYLVTDKKGNAILAIYTPMVSLDRMINGEIIEFKNYVRIVDYKTNDTYIVTE